MAKVEIDDKVIEKLVGKKVIKFKMDIDSLTRQVTRHKAKINKLEREIEMYRANKMDTDKETSDRIAKIARAFVGELERAKWVEPHYECGSVHYSDDCDQ